jgi:hypothetical protein
LKLPGDDSAVQVPQESPLPPPTPYPFPSPTWGGSPVPWPLATRIRCRASRVQISSLHMVTGREGSSRVSFPSVLLYNPVGSGTPRLSPRRQASRLGVRGVLCPGGAALATPVLPPALLSKCDPGGAPGRQGVSEEKEAKPSSRTRGASLPPLAPPTPTSSPRQGDLCDPARSLALLRNKRTTSGNFLRWPRCPPPAPPRPLVGFSRPTQSPPFQAPGPQDPFRADRGSKRGCRGSFRGAGFGGRG